MDETRTALKEWERRALLLMSVVGIGLCLFYASVSIQLPMRGVPKYFGTLVVSPMVAVFVLTIIFVWRGRGVGVFGFAIGAVLASVFFLYPHFFFWTVDEPNLSPAFMLKTSQMVFGPVLIAFMALTFRPGVAFGTAAAIVVLHLINLDLVFSDPRTIISDDPVAGIMGWAVLRAKAVAETAILVIAGAVATATAFAARQTVHRAVEFERANGHLRRYFSPDVADRLANSPQWQELSGGATRDVVVLFSDIANFTALSETLTPDETVRLLALYRERMVAEIFARRGTLDKFIGDGIFAVFGTFGGSSDAADRAIAAARGMMSALQKINAARIANGQPPISHRIGIHAGPALVGNVASAGQMEFTVIGNTVNMASRIEQSGKQLGESVILSEAIRQRVSDRIALRSLGQVALQGHQEPVELFTIEEQFSDATHAATFVTARAS